MIFLGIDPGFADMGYGVLAVEGGRQRCLAYGSIGTPAGSPLEDRLKFLYDELSKLIETHRPDSAAIEKLFFSKNAKTAMLVAEARGVIRLCLRQHNLDCREFSPAEVKLAVCSRGNAKKEEVQKMIKVLLGLKEIPRPDDAADALAIAITAAFTRK